MIIITGTSRGIGKAVAELYLAKGENVLGIGRTISINHQNYTHQFCDLSNPSEVEKLNFPTFDEPIIFIHNAGVLGEVGRFSELENSSHMEVMQVNFNAGVTLFHKLIHQTTQQFTCAFVSSGAGKRPIASWAAYCASKAAVDLFLETIFVEEKERNGSKIQVYSISPGVVDTGMQEKIRHSSPEDFSSIERFKSLHENGELIQPKHVAEKIASLLEQNPTNKVQWSLSEI